MSGGSERRQYVAAMNGGDVRWERNMRQLMVFLGLSLAAIGCVADDDTTSVPLPAAAAAAPAPPVPTLVPEPAWSPRPPRPRPTMAAAPTAPTADNAKPVQFSSEGKWDLAGYNNDEVIYTIFITSHDPRIIRCTTELKGFYYENGKKLSVADRQSSTVFPEQRVQAGNWQGMDEKSGATFSVKCRAV